ncbi:uncharacterized protein B0P05DRAFT_525413 [Gilbertella persicaria]|uniref:uncharacterized protein n=1 Tax=Gilbertella persicaria TaxID=101096 RepID=UPI0022210CE1|nr:uncharacterized protein B0P05DRAFT_525413 [Gilbertella persicaria]KAI8092242.1 hypothetical protein B0P05DRAFT_525413 [Gilbertella persicaria]
MENSNQQFHRQFLANEKMKERFELILTSPSENSAVKKELVSLLGAWAVKYKNEPGMRAVGELYELGRSGRRAPPPRPKVSTGSDGTPTSPQMKSPTTPITPSRALVTSPIPSPPRRRSPSPTREERRRSFPPPAPAATIPSSPKPTAKQTKPRSHSSAASTSRPGTNTTRVFNFEKAKPRILEEIAVANSNLNNLVNALKLINTSEDRWEIELQHDKRLQEYHDKCEESKKRIVRYARLVEDEEWIGTLLATNEELLKALDMYDIMLVGQIPAAWLQNQQVLATHRLEYQEPPKAIRAPPPPPPNKLALNLEDMQISKRNEPEEDDDPFADPPTPIEDEDRRGYLY